MQTPAEAWAPPAKRARSALCTPASAGAGALCAGPAAGQPHHMLHPAPAAKPLSAKAVLMAHLGIQRASRAARTVSRKGQRELQELFHITFGERTLSNNNMWLRKKLLEALEVEPQKHLDAVGGRRRRRKKKAGPAAAGTAAASTAPAASGAGAAGGMEEGEGSGEESGGSAGGDEGAASVPGAAQARQQPPGSAEAAGAAVGVPATMGPPVGLESSALLPRVPKRLAFCTRGLASRAAAAGSNAAGPAAAAVPILPSGPPGPAAPARRGQAAAATPPPNPFTLAAGAAGPAAAAPLANPDADQLVGGGAPVPASIDCHPLEPVGQETHAGIWQQDSRGSRGMVSGRSTSTLAQAPSVPSVPSVRGEVAQQQPAPGATPHGHASLLPHNGYAPAAPGAAASGSSPAAAPARGLWGAAWPPPATTTANKGLASSTGAGQMQHLLPVSLQRRAQPQAMLASAVPGLVAEAGTPMGSAGTAAGAPAAAADAPGAAPSLWRLPATATTATAADAVGTQADWQTDVLASLAGILFQSWDWAAAGGPVSTEAAAPAATATAPAISLAQQAQQAAHWTVSCAQHVQHAAPPPTAAWEQQHWQPGAHAVPSRPGLSSQVAAQQALQQSHHASPIPPHWQPWLQEGSKAAAALRSALVTWRWAPGGGQQQPQPQQHPLPHHHGQQQQQQQQQQRAVVNRDDLEEFFRSWLAADEPALPLPWAPTASFLGSLLQATMSHLQHHQQQQQQQHAAAPVEQQ